MSALEAELQELARSFARSVLGAVLGASLGELVALRSDDEAPAPKSGGGATFGPFAPSSSADARRGGLHRERAEVLEALARRSFDPRRRPSAFARRGGVAA